MRGYRNDNTRNCTAQVRGSQADRSNLHKGLAGQLTHRMAGGGVQASHAGVISMGSPVAAIFVVNPRSGGRSGARLLTQLEQRLGRERVFAIGSMDLAELVQRYHGRAEALVACGGDGTAAALLDCAWRAGSGIEPTPVAVWPLGTGNDLARFAGAPLSGSIDQRLAWLEAAVVTPLDRWVLQGPTGERSWFNYCSWGCDARIVQRFHRLRDHHPWAFASSLTNKLCYAGLGLQDFGSPLAVDISSAAHAARAPTWLRSLVLANIPSYAGGRRLGNQIAASDSACDAFALPAGIALGLGLSGMRKPRSLGAHHDLCVRLGRPAFLQVDGEPLIAQPGIYRINHGGRVRLLTQG